jgi:glycosyltransferase involved in cell wall biosynthesis
VKFSLCIPYKRRLDNIRLAFEGLADQTLDRGEFEVLVGAMEYSADYVDLCRAFDGRLDIVTVMSAREFSIPRARNLAMRQATGEVVVQLDADTLLPPTALEHLYEQYFASGQRVCVAGQVLGYDNNTGGDVSEVKVRPYAHYQAVFQRPDGPRDVRAGVEHLIPWTFAWTGLIALPAAAVRAHDLYFDETFRGWGVDDLEWGYRICANQIPILFREDVYGLHLPHLRNSGGNSTAARANGYRFLRKHPAPDVELAMAFGDVDSNGLYREFMTELRTVSEDNELCVVRDGDVLLIGVTDTAEHRGAAEILPLAGLRLPYPDASVGECRVLPAVDGFSPRYRDRIRSEARRVTRLRAVLGEALYEYGSVAVDEHGLDCSPALADLDREREPGRPVLAVDGGAGGGWMMDCAS